MLLDIVILPSAKLAGKLVKLERELAKSFKFDFIVDNKALYHHLSLYHLKSSPRNLSQIASALDEIRRKFGSLYLQFSGFQKDKANIEFVWLRVARSEPLYKLHKEIVIQTSRFRTGPMPRWSPPRSPLAKRYIEEYGKPAILRRFKPHFTLAKLADADNMSTVLKLLNQNKIGRTKASILALTEIDKNWQVKRIIRKFELR